MEENIYQQCKLLVDSATNDYSDDMEVIFFNDGSGKEFLLHGETIASVLFDDGENSLYDENTFKLYELNEKQYVMVLRQLSILLKDQGYKETI